MRELTTYFGEIIVITAVSGLLFAAAPEGNMKKYIRFVISIALAAALLMPFLSIAASLPKLLLSGTASARESEYAANPTENALVSASREELEKAIADYVAERYGIERGRVSCAVTLDAHDLSAIEIRRICLSLPTGYDTAEIERALREMFLYQSEIEIMEVT